MAPSEMGGHQRQTLVTTESAQSATRPTMIPATTPPGTAVNKTIASMWSTSKIVIDPHFKLQF